jgi:hypothetical protein
LTGLRRTLAPEEYSLKLMALQSLRFYQNQLDTALDGISPERDPWVLITEGYKKTSALAAFSESWERYRILNPEAAALLDDQTARWVDSHDVPVRSFEAQRLAQTSSLMKQISDMLVGEDDIRPDSLREIQGMISQLYSETGEFGVPNTPSEKAIAWWYNNVLDPYLEKTTPLYDQAELYQSAGLPAGPIYDEIRRITEQAPPEYRGKPVPSVEEMFFGNRTRAEQEVTVDKWATRPVTWLTEFQMDKVGYDFSPETLEFLRTAASVETGVYEGINAQGISYSSTEYDNIIDGMDAGLAELAQKTGPEAVRAYQLNKAAPYVRLESTGFGTTSPTWSQITAGAGMIAASLEARELSPKGFSELAVRYKTGLYAAITALREDDKAYDDLWVELSNAMPLPDGTPREYALLYEAILWGNFRTLDVPSTVTQAAYGGTTYGQ